MLFQEVYQFLRSRVSKEYSDSELYNLAHIILKKVKLTVYNTENYFTNLDNNPDLAYIIQSLNDSIPIQYIFEEAPFFEWMLYVNPSVLIPRPETEELVDWITQDYKKQHPRILDIGTGSGCIAIACAKKIPNSKVVALDISQKALDVARKNAIQLSANIEFLCMDILTQIPEGVLFDVIVSNPPYISQNEMKHMSQSTLAHEPSIALFTPTDDTLIFYRRLAEIGYQLLQESGTIYCELNEFHAAAIEEIFVREGYCVELRIDMQGKTRMLKAMILPEE